jgi:cell division transport system permease protein
MSVFVGGTFLLLTGNLNRVVEQWLDEARIIVYLRSDSSVQADLDLRELVAEPAWVAHVDEIPTAQAKSRFEATFPSVRGLLDDFEEDPLPDSLEVAYRPERVDAAAFENWLTLLRESPAVMMVDDDRDWLYQLEALIAILRSLGLVVGAALLGAAVFTIASVIRLTAYLYRDEIAVMRLVGATELYIRGPFYVEGLIQGFLGSAAAILTLFLCYLFLDPHTTTSFLGTVLVDEFLSWRALLALLALGSAAGLAGAVVSLRRETLT